MGIKKTEMTAAEKRENEIMDITALILDAYYFALVMKGYFENISRTECQNITGFQIKIFSEAIERLSMLS